MIEKLENTIIEYQTELQELTYDEIEKKEEDSFTINGIRLDEIAGIVNEKIKIADTFTHYIIERCKPNQVKILRKFIEEYERKIDLLKSGMLNFDEIDELKNITVAIDLLFGIDVSYYTLLSSMFSDMKIDRIYNYFSENINYNLNYEELRSSLEMKGYGI